MLRMFLVHRRRRRWRAMPGGLARILAEARPDRRHALAGSAKDVWVLAEEGGRHPRPRRAAGRRAAADPPRQRATAEPRGRQSLLARPLHRTAGARGAAGARAAARLAAAQPTPREMAEVRALARCLVRADLLVEARGRRRPRRRAADRGAAARGRGRAGRWRAVRPGLPPRRAAARPADRRHAGGVHCDAARAAGAAARRPAPRAGAADRDRRRRSVLRFSTTVAGARRREHGARRRVAVPRPRPADRAGAGDRRRGAARSTSRRCRPAGAHRGRAAARAGAVRFASSPTAAATSPSCSRRRCWTWCWPTRPIRAGWPSSLPPPATCWRSWMRTADRRRRGGAGRPAGRGGAGDGAFGGPDRGPGGGGAVPAAAPGGAGGASRRAVGPVAGRYFALLPVAHSLGLESREAARAGVA